MLDVRPQAILYSIANINPGFVCGISLYCGFSNCLLAWVLLFHVESVWLAGFPENLKQDLQNFYSKMFKFHNWKTMNSSSACIYISSVHNALQMKGRWESNIYVWFPFMYSQKWNCYFQNRIIMFCLPVPTLIYLWELHIFPRSTCLFCCREICRPILGIYKSLIDTWMWELGLRPRNS